MKLFPANLYSETKACFGDWKDSQTVEKPVSLITKSYLSEQVKEENQQ